MHEDRISNILIDNKIRFTQPIFFNDPFEIKLVSKGFKTKNELKKQFLKEFEKNIFKEYTSNDVIKNIMNYKDFLLHVNTNKEEYLNKFIATATDDNLNKEFIKTFDEKLNNVLGILSLTAKEDNLLMWAHYANEHKGFVIEFEKENAFFEPMDANNYIYKGIQKVNYSKKRPNNFLSDYNFDELFLTKSIEWEYEEEYRIIKRLDGADEIKEKIYLFNFPKNLIKAIYCGFNMNSEKKNTILKIIMKDEELHHIKVFDTKISDKYYKLEFHEIR